MSKEIERKFLVKEIPNSCVVANSKVFVEQYYLHISDLRELRIRKAVYRNDDGVCTLTAKIGQGLVREEYNENISPHIYEILEELSGSDKPIEKQRLLIRFDNGEEGIYDKYLNLPYDLEVVELEFDSIEKANNFNPPEWCVEEITEDKNYKNKNLYQNLNNIS